jgi:hypothetical protein
VVAVEDLLHLQLRVDDYPPWTHDEELLILSVREHSHEGDCLVQGGLHVHLSLVLSLEAVLREAACVVIVEDRKVVGQVLLEIGCSVNKVINLDDDLFDLFVCVLGEVSQVLREYPPFFVL